MGPFGKLSPSKSGSEILVDPGGVFPLSDPPPGGTLPPGEEGLPSCPDDVGTPDVVAMVVMNALSIENDPFADGYGHTEMIAIDGYRCEIVDGMRVYYGDSRMNRIGKILRCYRSAICDYNFDVPDGMDLMFGAVWIRNAGYGEDGYDACMSDNFKCSGRQVGHWEYLSVGECCQCKRFGVCR